MLMRQVSDKETENFKWWPRLHGYWRTLPNFNPYTVSSDPGQNLSDEAAGVLLGGLGFRTVCVSVFFMNMADRTAI
jgi:hypothetical protein